MVFAEDELHCDIFALVLITQRIFVVPCELADISWALVLFWDPLYFVSLDFRVRFHICF